MSKNVEDVLNKLVRAGFEAAVVGGAVRDLIVGKNVQDWDLTTNAKPEEIQNLFAEGFYNNKFGTVGIPSDEGVIEVTTYRSESNYSDTRHPDKVVWGKSLEEDLKRRDFTINAMALRFTKEDGNYKFLFGVKTVFGKTISNFKLVDPFGGKNDLDEKTVRAVGDPNERFREDALRILRAVRFAATLGFEIEKNTLMALKNNVSLLSKISGERVREELFKIIEGENRAEGILLLRQTGILSVILPELEACFSVEQKSPKRHHIYDVGTHCVMSMKCCPSKKVTVLFATLLHDIGKAKVANVTQEGVRTFYNHEVAGANMVLKIAKRLHLSGDQRDEIYKLVRWHQFSVNENQTDRALRRFIKNVGTDKVEDMMDLRIGDRLGGGLQQPESWRLKLFRKRLEEVMTLPFSVKDLKVDGNDVMKILGVGQGPKVGEVLNKLFEEVEEDPAKNNEEYLKTRIREIS